MSRLIYLTHPQVQIAPQVPVPDWDLNTIGRARIQSLVAAPWLAQVTAIVSSPERKALTGAQMIGAGLGIVPRVRDDMGENDRSTTGFLPGPAFEAMADAFFANPEVSVRGWERAVDAQARIVRAVLGEVARHPSGDLLCVGHGAVGTLLMTHAAGWSISRAYDQPEGGGNIFALSLPTLALIHGWRPLEASQIGTAA